VNWAPACKSSARLKMAGDTSYAYSCSCAHRCSRGTIKINSTNIFDNPLVDFGALTDPTDTELLFALIRKNRQIMATPFMQQLGPTKLTPGASLTTRRPAERSNSSTSLRNGFSHLFRIRLQMPKRAEVDESPSASSPE
jgi:GMC oxidoreductase